MQVTVRTKVWLEVAGGVPFCHGKAALLSAIEKHGSIRQAASVLNMSYRRAWEYIRDLEKGIDSTVVRTKIGGSRGGGSQLTETGIELLRFYEKTLSAVADAVRLQGGTAV